MVWLTERGQGRDSWFVPAFLSFLGRWGQLAVDGVDGEGFRIE